MAKKKHLYVHLNEFPFGLNNKHGTVKRVNLMFIYIP